MLRLVERICAVHVSGCPRRSIGGRPGPRTPADTTGPHRHWRGGCARQSRATHPAAQVGHQVGGTQHGARSPGLQVRAPAIRPVTRLSAQPEPSPLFEATEALPVRLLKSALYFGSAVAPKYSIERGEEPRWLLGSG